MVTVLLADDEPAVLEALVGYCQDAAVEVITASDGKEALRAFFQKRPDIVVSDIRMPGLNGFELVSRIREVSDIPIIALSVLGQEEDKVQGLRLGADDYLVKPLGMQEFIARLQSALRRAKPRDEEEKTVYSDDYLTIRLDRQEVFWKGKKLELTPKEFRLLAYLAHREGKVVPVSELLSGVWGSPHYSEDSVKWHIASLRRKIEEKPHEPKHILTVWGTGYRYDRPTVPSPAPVVAN